MHQAILALALPLCFSACAAPAAVRAPSVPDLLKVPVGNHFAFQLQASGVQIYTCRPKADAPVQYEWAFKAPEARLTELGDEVGQHHAGPTWESTNGSKVVGNKQQTVDAPGAGDIPWLLLSAKSNEGQGRFAKVAFIQRIATHGGQPPAGGADAQHAGQEARVPYTATYCFYVAD